MATPVIQKTTAERVVETFRNDFKARLLEKFEAVNGGPLDGISIVSRGNFDDVWRAFWDDFEMPLPSDNAAELRTPGRVVLALVCPECGEQSPASVRLHAVHTADGSKRTLKVKGMTTAVDHVHGQQSLPEAKADEVGTEPFELSDITGDVSAVPEDADAPADDKPADDVVSETHAFRPNRSGRKCIDCQQPDGLPNHPAVSDPDVGDDLLP